MFTSWRLPCIVGVAGAVIGLAASYFIENRYTSTAELRPMVGGVESAMRMEAVAWNVLGRPGLLRILQQPEPAVYERQRAELTLEDVVEQAKTDTHAEWMTHEGGPVYRVSFTYPDARKAQAMAERLSAAFKDQMPVTEVKTADLPARADGPPRTVYAAVGLGIGLTIGCVALAVWKQPRRSLRAAALGLVGCWLTVGLSLAFLPDRYESTAVLRLIGRHSEEAPAAWLQEVLNESVNRSNISRMIWWPSLDLYPRERARRISQAVADMALRRDLRIEPVNTPWSETMPETRISFTYPDAAKARMMVRELVTKLEEQNLFKQRLLGQDLFTLCTMKDASMPVKPVSPNRWAIAIGGLMVGLAAGIWHTRSAAPRSAPLRSV